MRPLSSITRRYGNEMQLAALPRMCRLPLIPFRHSVIVVWFTSSVKSYSTVTGNQG